MPGGTASAPEAPVVLRAEPGESRKSWDVLDRTLVLSVKETPMETE